MEKNQANKNGREYEEINNIVEHLKIIPNIIVNEIRKKKIGNKTDYNYRAHEIIQNNKLIGVAFKGYNLYKYFDLTIKNSNGIALWNTLISKKILPDYCYYDINNKILYVFEMKYQDGAGSVDEKLQSFPFKVKQFEKLLNNKVPGIKVYYWYILYFDHN